ncbi:MAG: Na+/H+ antiporter subunit E, partial [Lentisphaerota bacterium]
VMVSFLITTGFAFVIYLLLTAGSGPVLHFWSQEELLAGAIFSIITGAMGRKFFGQSRPGAVANPLRWIRGLVYVFGPFFVEMTKANLDVAYRVITGKIRPGIVKVKSGMKTDMGVLMLANSITLTPGTLTVGIDEETNDLYIHMINIPEGLEQKESLDARELFSFFDCPAKIRRIAE